jgi:DNA-binding MarR family transcriptional regulator
LNKEKIVGIFADIGVEAEVLDFELSLPISYDVRYRSFELNLSGSVYLLIKEKRPGSIETFVNQARFIADKAKLPFILYFSKLSNSNKKLLLKARIPFLTDEVEMFIPDMGMLLKSISQAEITSNFTPSQQLVFIHLLLFSGNEIEIEKIKENIGISEPTIYRSLRSFVEKGWLESTHGSYIFAKKKVEIYSDGKQFLFNPLDRKIYISDSTLEFLNSDFNHKVKKAGTKALSELTLIDENKYILATGKKFYGKISKLPYFQSMAKPILYKNELQIWKYQPISSGNAGNDDFLSLNLVDPISLIMSFEEDDDPRIESEIEKLEKMIINKFKDSDLGGSNGS